MYLCKWIFYPIYLLGNGDEKLLIVVNMRGRGGEQKCSQFIDGMVKNLCLFRDDVDFGFQIQHNTMAGPKYK